MLKFGNMVSVALCAAGLIATTGAVLSEDTIAQGASTGWFADLDAGAAFRYGSSSTTTGGAFNSGTAYGVEFDPALRLGGSFGFQYSPALDVFLSYNYIDGATRWKADFGPGADTAFDGRAHSHVVLANARYGHEFSPSTRISALLGAGIAINALSGVVESDAVTGTKVSDIADGSVTSFAARTGLELTHDLSQNVSLKLGAGLDYYGGFKTGTSRLRLGANQPIGAYELQPAWGVTVSAGLTARF